MQKEKSEQELEENLNWLSEYLKASEIKEVNSNKLPEVDKAIPILHKVVDNYKNRSYISNYSNKFDPKILFKVFMQKNLWPALAIDKKAKLFPMAFLGLGGDTAKEIGEFIIQDLKENKVQHIIANNEIITALFSSIKSTFEIKTQLKILNNINFEPEEESWGFTRNSKQAITADYQKFGSYFNLMGETMPFGSWSWQTKGGGRELAIQKLTQMANKYIQAPMNEQIIEGRVRRYQFDTSFFDFIGEKKLGAKDIYQNAMEYVFTPSNFDLIISKYPQFILFYDMENLTLGQIKSFKNSLKEHLILKNQLNQSIARKESQEDRGHTYNKVNAVNQFNSTLGTSIFKSFNSFGKYLNLPGFESEAKEIEALAILGMDDALNRSHIFEHINSLDLTLVQKIKYMNDSVTALIGKLGEDKNDNKEGNGENLASMSLEQITQRNIKSLENSRKMGGELSFYRPTYQRGVIQFIKALKYTKHAKKEIMLEAGEAQEVVGAAEEKGADGSHLKLQMQIQMQLGDAIQFQEICLENPEILNWQHVSQYPENIKKFIWEMGEDIDFLTQFLKSHPGKAESFSPSNLDSLVDKEAIKIVLENNPNILINLKGKQWFEKDIIGAIFTTSNRNKIVDGDKLYRHILKNNKSISSLDSIEFWIDQLINLEENKMKEVMHEPSDSQMAYKVRLNLEIQNRAENLIHFVTSRVLDNLFFKEISKQGDRVFSIYEKILILNSKRKKPLSYGTSVPEVSDSSLPHMPLCVVQNVDWVMAMIDKYPQSSLAPYCKPILVHSRKFSLYLVGEICKKTKSESFASIKSYLPKELKEFFEAANIKDNCENFLRSYFEKKNLIAALSTAEEKKILIQYNAGEGELEIIDKNYIGKNGGVLDASHSDSDSDSDSDNDNNLETLALEAEPVMVSPIKKNKI